MTSLIESIIGETDATISKYNHGGRHLYCRNVLRSKNTTCKLKFKKALKRKLKQYKIRQDGKEDQDIIDVSENLLSSLVIRSPNKQKNRFELELEKLRPKNYLFKMLRRKQTTLITTKVSNPTEIKVLTENEIIQVSPTMEAKKQTNAFQLLMESRNKSLGSNSPGKEKSIDLSEMHELIDKKNVKAKRNLMLQQMAEAKGSLKNKEIAEQQEKYIKKKMEKRAEKLKSMLLNKELKPVIDNKPRMVSSSRKTQSPLDSIELDINDQIQKPVKTLQLVNIFSETINNISPEKKHFPKEDQEFLNKLSPSIRKKESVLSYFKKVEKDIDNALADSENDDVVKVKLTSKLKKRGRKKKLRLNRDCQTSCGLPENRTETIALDNGSKVNDTNVIKLERQEIQQRLNLNKNEGKHSMKSQKRKREEKESNCLSETRPITIDLTSNNDTRPRRTMKRPVKYNDDVSLSSSNEELHIFTPKKPKRSEHKTNLVTKTIGNLNSSANVNDEVKRKSLKKSTLDEGENMTKISMKKKKVKVVTQTKPVKLAPIFAKAQSDQAAIEAKQKFLQSGVPEQLKKLMSKQKDSCALSNSFEKVVHIQQLNMACMPSSSKPLLNDMPYMDGEEICSDYDNVSFRNILNLSSSQIVPNTQLKSHMSTQAVLQHLKETYPRFPVYRTYRLLRGKKKGEFKDRNIFSNLDNSVEILNCSIDMQNDNPDQLTWSDKYKPLSGHEIIGNFESVNELRKWLVMWTENETKSKISNSNESDSTDYYQSDPDSRDSVKSYNSLLILSGPVGSGKTSSVYAVAAELSIKVIEVNASSKRTGKIMLQDLQEATQSHKVNRATGSSENSQKSQELIEPLVKTTQVKKRGRPKKVLQQALPKKCVVKEKPVISNGFTASQEISRTAMSLILIDDAHIVFDQDDGFCSAIVQLVHCSKRPVILITESLSCSHLQRFFQHSKILKMQPLLPNMLGTWLDIMCLADSGICWSGAGANFLNFFNGDIRKTMNCLQFYVSGQEQYLSMDEHTQTDSQNIDTVKANAENENSNMSWADPDISENRHLKDGALDSQWLWTCFTKGHLNQLRYPFDIFHIWWSVPKLLKVSDSVCNSERLTKNVDENKIKSKEVLELMCNVLDTTSVCDYFSQRRPEAKMNLTSHPWYYSECESVSELENMDSYDQNHAISNEISFELINSSTSRAQEKLGMESRYDLDFPGMNAKRQRDRIISQHNSLTSYLFPQAALDRKALALDYWSSCRTICRIEKSKTDSNFKRNRNNRFCHYLKSLSGFCKNDSFNNLANSLKPSGNL